jgi:pyrroline-5-carboxylate reductase
MDQTNISFIGCGNMGQSLIGGLVANGHNPDTIHAADPDPAKRDLISKQYKVRVYAENTRAIEHARVIVLAVKPQLIMQTLSGMATEIRKKSPLIISIAAGIRLATLETAIGDILPVVRVMPNTPALVGAGASALYANPNVTREQRQLAESIMQSAGLAVWLENESAMDTVTALSGSGPAYFFLIMEVMEKAAIQLGLPANQARLLTIQTALGAAKMAAESKVDAATLRQQVTSPGGTTERALKVLMEKGNIEVLFLEALLAAKRRSEELAALAGRPE